MHQDQAKLDRIRKAERFRLLNRDVIPGGIVCAGSSLMEMFPVERFVEEYGWKLRIYNRGIGGYLTTDLLDDLDVCILDLKPSRLFLNIGTNDLSWSSITIEQIMDNYERILKRIKAALPECEIYLMAYFPINYEAASEAMKPCLKIRSNERLALANKEVEKLAARCGAMYIDINDALKDEQGRLKAEYTYEGMHIKEDGYRAIFQDFMKYAAQPAWDQEVRYEKE